MATLPMTHTSSRPMLWSGWIVSILPALFLLMDAAMKLTRTDAATKAMAEIGYPVSELFTLGVVLLVCTVIYLVPKSKVLGAILLTAYLGGAVASHVRLEQGTHAIVPIVIAVLLWLGIYLRDDRLRQVVPIEQ